MKLFEVVKKIKTEYLYHATYKPLLDSIKKDGLRPKVSNKSWNISANYIYLSPDKNVAESYAETSDTVPDSYIDKNNHSGDTYQYDDVIPWKYLKRV